jgi:hypothetical protein
MDDIVKTINAARLANKNAWYFLTLDFNGALIQVKGYNTWLQIFRINGIDHSNNMDASASAFKSHILNSLQGA